MKFWKRWIADIQSKTTVLTLLERGAYTELLDHYYTEGGPITGDHAMLYRICRAFDRHEREAIDKMLSTYFHKTEAGRYMNRRAQEEIERASEYSEAQRQRSELAVAARQVKAAGKPKRERVNGASFTPPEWINRENWDAWIKIRPARARTPDALRAACQKLEKLKAKGHDGNELIANSLANGWQGLIVPDGSRGMKKLSLAESNRLAGEEAQRQFDEEQRNAGK